MNSQSYPLLFSPLTLGSRTLRNRIVMAPHGVSFLGGYGNAIDRVIDYHVERARGGAAMIVMSNFVMPRSWKELGNWGGNLSTTSFGTLDMADDASLLSAYSRLAKAIQDEGALFVSQLNATGRQYYSTGMTNFGIPLLAPSSLPCPRTRQIPREMTKFDIAELLDAFGDAASNLQKAGADGVELLAAQGYLLSEFLSPHTNRRTDEYGGNAENRMRIVVEAIEAIRSRVGSSFIVGIRMNGQDYAPGGLTVSETSEIARRLTAKGHVDYLHVSGMTYLQYPAWIADFNAAEALFSEAAGEIRKSASPVPVCVTSRIGSPAVAEEVLTTGRADLIGMARALIADPELPSKALRGQSEDIRVCTYSNQSCSMGQSLGRGVACMQNVAVGKEAQLGIGKMRRANRAKKVLVVGGGPAGLAAARVAAERGHDVALYEKGAALGGQNRMTARIPGRRGFAEVTRWQESQLRKSRIKIVLDSNIGAEFVRNENPDAVIIATGSRPIRSGYSSFRPDVAFLPGSDQDNVLTVFDVFSTPERIGKRVLLLDDDPHFSGVYTAEFLATVGHEVQIITPQLYAGRELHINFIPNLYHRLAELRITVAPGRLATSIEGDRMVSIDRFTGQSHSSEAFDTFVLSTGNEVVNTLYQELLGQVSELYRIGDCVAPRKIDDAILDGERAAWML
ncbi:FAD-dependent oxidoreductase [Microvirga puerhi]|uniref:FAD-dependent oxidoreductase n=1 Tax=Microvirga puerhi TaxID=2876078 RepID=A0ABS7VRL2_9HYPH|nr:FAD-dependent oxidoreductase [Microvirga puerhi]MBZ6078198.1 FAD-dependent oxidoreductase [Microvirga puerhi]